MFPSSEDQYNEEEKAASAQLQKCDMMAIMAALLGLVLQLTGLSFSIRFKDSILVYLLVPILGICSILFILGGYFIGHKKTAIPWSQLIPHATIRPIHRITKIISYAVASFVVVSTVTLMVVFIFRLTPDLESNFLLDSFKAGKWSVRLLLLVEVCLAAPVFEELLFRLAIPRCLSSYGLSTINANLITSMIFALFHFILRGIPGLFLFSLILCQVRRQQDIYSCIAVHSLYNLFVAVTAVMAS